MTGGKAFVDTNKNIHDANIIATMLAYDIDTLLTMNTKDFIRFSAEIRLIGLGDPV